MSETPLMRETPTVDVYVESDAGMAEDHFSAAWTFDLDLWGLCGQGPDERTALASLAAEVAPHLASRDLVSHRPASHNPASHNPASHNPASRNPGSRNPGSRDPATFNPATYMPATYVPAAYVPATFNPATFNPATFNPATYVPAACEPAIGGPAIGGPRLVVVERITGDEQAFLRDRKAATAAERRATLTILDAARRETLALIQTCPRAVLDFDDPDRVLPSWARWRTLRQTTWHLADTECRYYLPSVGRPSRPADPDLITELVISGQHVRAAVATMAADMVRPHDSRHDADDRPGVEVWTTTKVLRRLAWHERSELVTMRRLARRAIAET
jgi:hypothetical protein